MVVPQNPEAKVASGLVLTRGAVGLEHVHLAGPEVVAGRVGQLGVHASTAIPFCWASIFT